MYSSKRKKCHKIFSKGVFKINQICSTFINLKLLDSKFQKTVLTVKSIQILPYFVFLLLFACSPEEETSPNQPGNTPGETPQPNYATLEVNVTYCNRQLDPACENREPVRDAYIKIYDNNIDRINDENVVASGTTNADGFVGFYTLKGKFYYLFVSSPHGNKEMEEQTVAGGKTFLFIDY